MYQVRYNIDLIKVLKYIPTKDQLKLKSFLQSLHNIKDPFIHAKKLKGANTLYRYRIGHYRILCDISNCKLTILVIDIAHRKDVYKNL